MDVKQVRQVPSWEVAIEAAMADDLGDELLGLIFTACHPTLSPDTRAALTLRMVGALSPDEIGCAFLSNGAAIAQLIVGAKTPIARTGLHWRRRGTPNGRRGCPRCSRPSTSSSVKAMLDFRRENSRPRRLAAVAGAYSATSASGAHSFDPGLPRHAPALKTLVAAHLKRQVTPLGW
jgi:hypothetical protein